MGEGHTRKREATHELHIHSSGQGKCTRTTTSSSSRNADVQESLHLHQMREVAAEAALVAARTVAREFEDRQEMLPSGSRSPVADCSANEFTRSPYSATKEADMERLVTNLGQDYIQDNVWNIQTTRTDREAGVQHVGDTGALDVAATVVEEGMQVDSLQTVDVLREHDKTTTDDVNMELGKMNSGQDIADGDQIEAQEKLVPNVGERDSEVGMIRGIIHFQASVVEDGKIGSVVGEKDEREGRVDSGTIATTVELEDTRIKGGTAPIEMEVGEMVEEVSVSDSAPIGEKIVEMGVTDTGPTEMEVGERVEEVDVSGPTPAREKLVLDQGGDAGHTEMAVGEKVEERTVSDSAPSGENIAEVEVRDLVPIEMDMGEMLPELAVRDSTPAQKESRERLQDLVLRGTAPTGEKGVQEEGIDMDFIEMYVGEKLEEVVVRDTAPTAMEVGKKLEAEDVFPSGPTEMDKGEGRTGTGVPEDGTDPVPKELDVEEGFTDATGDLAGAVDDTGSKECEIYSDSWDLNSGEGSDDTEFESALTNSVPRTLLLYSTFRVKSPDMLTRVNAHGLHLLQQDFDELEDPKTALAQMHMDLLLWLFQIKLAKWRLLKDGIDGENTIVLQSFFFVITACLIDEHWVTVRINLHLWSIDLYDSLIYKTRDSSDDEIYHRHEHQLWSLMYMIPPLLKAASYWQHQNGPEKLKKLQFRCAPKTIQYKQTDSVSCGVFAMMSVQRLISSKRPPMNSEKEFVCAYRRLLALRLYQQCKDN
ncbi:hypothetical protein C2S52_000951 [Perilla frutescens var. hirtella]|nr:hypothetical protein C2S52_000951 [Perilla frutescens var. hirtella]